jgi:dipeptidyl aminopeptidase/acylaminoacyl peptidase
MTSHTLPALPARTPTRHRPPALGPRPWQRAFTLGCSLVGALVLAACTHAPDAAPKRAAAPHTASPLLTPPPALHVEGLPPLPQAIVERSRRYSDVAGHNFVAWHPTRTEMLVAHRPPQASTTQIFRLRSPLGALEPLTQGTDPVSQARWDPSGRYVVFTRGRAGDEAFQLFRIDPETRAETQITPNGERHAAGPWLKSRGLMIVGSVPLDRTAQGGTRAQIETTLSAFDPMNPGQRKVLAKLPGGGWFSGAVSPDERTLALTRYLSVTRSEVWLLDLTHLDEPQRITRRRVLPAGDAPTQSAHFVQEFSADGRHLFVTSDREGEFREALRVDLASGAATRLTAHIPWDVSDVDLSQGRDAGRWLALTANVDGRDELRLFDPASGTEQALPASAVPGGSVTRLAFHQAGGPLAVVVTSSQGPGQIHAIDLASGQRTQWTRPVVPEGLDLSTLPEQRVVRWTSFDGLTVSGQLSLPPAHFKGPRPVLMLVHGGPEAQAKAGWMGRFNYLLMERGVAILQPNVRGSTGYGKTFVNLDNGKLREDSVRDLGAALDWITAQPNLDGARVVVMGGSYGGYMALAASVHFADRIAGAVSTVGISNFISFLENTESYRRDLRRVEYGDEREPAMRAFLQSISPLNHVDRITRPLLVVQGKNDPRVPWTESEQIVRALQARGTPVGYLLADNEGHGFARRENAEYYFGSVVQFFDSATRGR